MQSGGTDLGIGEGVASKVVGLIVAVIVLGAVLVPIVDGLAGSMDGGGSGGGSNGGNIAEQYVYDYHNGSNSQTVIYFLTVDDGRTGDVVYTWNDIMFMMEFGLNITDRSQWSGYIGFYYDYVDDEEIIVFQAETYGMYDDETILSYQYDNVTSATLTISTDNRITIELTYLDGVETDATVTIDSPYIYVPVLPTVDDMMGPNAFCEIATGIWENEKYYVSIGSKILINSVSGVTRLEYNGESEIDTGVPADGGGNVMLEFTQVDALHWAVNIDGESQMIQVMISNAYRSEIPQIRFNKIDEGNVNIYLHANGRTDSVLVETSDGTSFEVDSPLVTRDNPMGIQILAMGVDWALMMGGEGSMVMAIFMDENDGSISIYTSPNLYAPNKGMEMRINGSNVRIMNLDGTTNLQWYSQSNVSYVPYQTGEYISVTNMSDDSLDYTGTLQYQRDIDPETSDLVFTNGIFDVVQGIAPSAQVNRQGYIAEKPAREYVSPTESGSNEAHVLTKMSYGSGAFSIDVSDDETADGVPVMPIVYADDGYLIYNNPHTYDTVYVVGNGHSLSWDLQNVYITNVSSDGSIVTVTYASTDGGSDYQTYQFTPASAGYYVDPNGQYGTYLNPFVAGNMGMYDSLYAPSDISSVPIVFEGMGTLSAGYDDYCFPGMYDTSVSEIERDYTVENGVLTGIGWNLTLHTFSDEFVDGSQVASFCILPNVVDNGSSGGGGEGGEFRYRHPVKDDPSVRGSCHLNGHRNGDLQSWDDLKNHLRPFQGRFL